MKTLAKNINNDIFAMAGQLVIAEGAECRSTIIDSMVKTQRGELQFSPGNGIDYFGTVFTSPRYITIWAGQVRTAIQNLEWVKDISDFSYEFDAKTGSLSWSMTVETQYGDEVTADSGGSFLYNTGDGRMGIRWEDIVGKPENMDEAISKMLEMQSAISSVQKLSPDSSLGDTKSTVNAIRDGIVGGAV